MKNEKRFRVVVSNNKKISIIYARAENSAEAKRDVKKALLAGYKITEVKEVK